MKPDRSRYDLVVIGAGAAGSEAAFAAASPQKRILLVEARHFGGTCTNHGCVPTKALVRAARILHQARRAREYGLRIPEPSFDWEAVMRRVQGVRDHMLRWGASPFQERGIEVANPATARLLGERWSR